MQSEAPAPLPSSDGEPSHIQHNGLIGQEAEWAHRGNPQGEKIYTSLNLF